MGQILGGSQELVLFCLKISLALMMFARQTLGTKSIACQQLYKIEMLPASTNFQQWCK